MATCISYEILLDNKIVVKNGQKTSVPVVKFSGSATGERSWDFAGRLMALAAEFHEPCPPLPEDQQK